MKNGNGQVKHSDQETGDRPARPKEPGSFSELDAAVWSVVSFEKCEASALTYEEARTKMADLDANGVNGLCIVTDAAAETVAH